VRASVRRRGHAVAVRHGVRLVRWCRERLLLISRAPSTARYEKHTTQTHRPVCVARTTAIIARAATTLSAHLVAPRPWKMRARNVCLHPISDFANSIVRVGRLRGVCVAVGACVSDRESGIKCSHGKANP